MANLILIMNVKVKVVSISNLLSKNVIAYLIWRDMIVAPIRSKQIEWSLSDILTLLQSCHLQQSYSDRSKEKECVSLVKLISDRRTHYYHINNPKIHVLLSSVFSGSIRPIEYSVHSFHSVF